MRRHKKEGYTDGDINFRVNVAYGEEQKRRAPADAKFPGCDARGWPIRWAPRDRFSELNILACTRRVFKIRWAHACRSVWLENIARLHHVLECARAADRPRLP